MPEVFNVDDVDNDLENDDENDGGDGDETQTLEIKVPRNSRASNVAHKPVANAAEVPLFPNADKDLRNTVAYLKIIKQNKPKAGYRGMLPPNATLENISLEYGNGVYTIEACSSDHIVLRREMNVQVTVDMGDGDNRPAGSAGSDMAVAVAIKSLHEGHKAELDRNTKLIESSSVREHERSKEYTTMIRETAKESREAMQQFYQASAKQSQDFMGSLMAAQNLGFQQNMAMLIKGHEMTLAQIKASQDQNNPMLMVQVMLQGLRLGQDLGGDGDEPDYIKALKVGGDMIGNLVELSQNGPVMQQPKQIQQSTETTPKQAPPPGTTSSGKKLLEVDEIKKMLELKKTLREQGIDLSTFLEQAKLSYHKEPDESDSTDNKEPEATGEAT